MKTQTGIGCQDSKALFLLYSGDLEMDRRDRNRQATNPSCILSRRRRSILAQGKINHQPDCPLCSHIGRDGSNDTYLRESIFIVKKDGEKVNTGMGELSLIRCWNAMC